jgi:hypothetical protein
VPGVSDHSGELAAGPSIGQECLDLAQPLQISIQNVEKSTTRLVEPRKFSRSAQTDSGAVALYGVALATLDDDPGVRPDAHAFIIDKAPWFAVTDDLPQYPARIPGQNAPHNS